MTYPDNEISGKLTDMAIDFVEDARLPNEKVTDTISRLLEEYALKVVTIRNVKTGENFRKVV